MKKILLSVLLSVVLLAACSNAGAARGPVETQEMAEVEITSSAEPTVVLVSETLEPVTEESALPQSNNGVTDNAGNPYFFPVGTSIVDYHMTSYADYEEDRVVQVRVRQIGTYGDGVLFEINLGYDFSIFRGVCPARMGYYYVTQDKIYRLEQPEDEDGYTKSLAPDENSVEYLMRTGKLSAKCDLVCQDEATDHPEGNGTPDSRNSYIEAQGDMRTFHYWILNSMGNGYYSKTISWEKGKGIVGYVRTIAAACTVIELTQISPAL